MHTYVHSTFYYFAWIKQKLLSQWYAHAGMLDWNVDHIGSAGRSLLADFSLIDWRNFNISTWGYEGNKHEFQAFLSISTKIYSSPNSTHIAQLYCM